MDTETNWTVEVYDNATSEHYERECSPEELAFYEQLAEEQANAPTIPTSDSTTDAG